MKLDIRLRSASQSSEMAEETFWCLLKSTLVVAETNVPMLTEITILTGRLE